MGGGVPGRPGERNIYARFALLQQLGDPTGDPRCEALWIKLTIDTRDWVNEEEEHALHERFMADLLRIDEQVQPTGTLGRWAVDAMLAFGNELSKGWEAELQALAWRTGLRTAEDDVESAEFHLDRLWGAANIIGRNVPLNAYLAPLRDELACHLDRIISPSRGRAGRVVEVRADAAAALAVAAAQENRTQGVRHHTQRVLNMIQELRSEGHGPDELHLRAFVARAAFECADAMLMIGRPKDARGPPRRDRNRLASRFRGNRAPRTSPQPGLAAGALDVSGPIVEFVENAFEASVAEILHTLATNPDHVLDRSEAVQALIEDAWSGVELSVNQDAEKLGELWPVLPDTLSDAFTLARLRTDSKRRIGLPHQTSEDSLREIQGLLLYAHGVHIPNPLRAEDGNTPASSGEFLHGVAQVCVLAPLIRGGVVRIFDPADAGGATAEDLEKVKMHVGLAVQSYEDLFGLEQAVAYEIGAALVDRALERLRDVAAHPTHEGTLLFPTRFDRAVLEMVVGELAQAAPATAASDDDPHAIQLDRLQRLSLPGLKTLELEDMVSIRSDDSFGIFRADMRAALSDVDTDLRGGNLEAARRTMGEHMDAGLARLNGRTRAGILNDVLVSGAVGWGIGAAVMQSLATFGAVVSGLLGRTALEYVRSRPTEGRRALRAHYVELGTGRLDEREVDLVSFSSLELWGRARGRPVRIENRKRTVRRLLDDLDG